MKDFAARVPTTALTVTALYEALSVVAEATMHELVVLDVHAVVRHMSTPVPDAVGVKL